MKGLRFILYFWLLAIALPEGAFSENDTASVRLPLIFAAVNLGNPFETFNEFQPLMDYLSTQTGLEIELYVGKDYEDVVYALRDNRAQIGFLGGIIYLQARKYLGVVPLVQPVDRHGLPFYQSLCIARSSSPINSLKDAAGKRVCCGSLYSTSGYWVPRHMFYEATPSLGNLVCDERQASHKEIIKSVLKGSCDIGFIKDLALTDAESAEIKVVQASRPIPAYPIVAVKGMPDSLRQKITEALVKIDAAVIRNLPFHDQLNREFLNGFTWASDSSFEPLRRIVKDLEGEKWPAALELH